MKNNRVKLGVVFILLSLVFLSVSAFISQLSGQKQMLTNMEFLEPTAQDQNEFISVWNTTKTSDGSSANNQVHLPLTGVGVYNFMVNWGDTNNDIITIWNQTEVIHTYVSAGLYTITITGTIIGWRFNNGGDKLKIIEIQHWGCLQLGNSGSYFFGCENLELTAVDNLNLTGTSSLYRAFAYCTNIGNSGNMNGWDVSKVTIMSWTFEGSSSFNQPIGAWNVSRVTDMSGMFAKAYLFNQPIGDWDVSSVTYMGGMFFDADSFNQPIGNWNVSSVYDMGFMFTQAYSFNQPIDNWDVSSVINMNSMFLNTHSFNQPIGGWDVSSVTNMGDMFYGASLFNQPLDNWNVSSVMTMDHMFYYASSFNQPIGSWDVSSVMNMGYMFYAASSFNQPLGSWDVSNVTDMSNMFVGVTLSIYNYDILLLGWSQLSLQTGVSFHAGYSKYSKLAEGARQTIITNFGWTIIDGGLAPPKTDREIPSYDLMLIIVVLGFTIFLLMKKRILYQT
jgi:surface protein